MFFGGWRDGLTAITVLDSSPKVSSAFFCPQAPGTPHGAQTDTHSDKTLIHIELKINIS